ncbi:MAG: HYR domain-containing protein, partial [Nocardioidaceae bacterium]
MIRALSRPASAVLAALVLLSGLSVLAVASAPPSGATHFRATQLSWHKSANPNTPRLVEFHFTGSFRRSYFTQQGYSANVGTTVPIQATDSISGLFFGDGQRLTDFNATVVSIDSANDQLTVEAHLTHTYSGTATTFTAYYHNCCRLSGPAHRNNPDRASRQETLVSLAAGVTASPESAVSPVVDCPVNALCQFFVPATDADSADLSYRLATSAEASGTGANSGFIQPRSTNGANVASMHPTTGLYSWNTTGASMASGNTASFFSTQVVVEKRLPGVPTPVSKLAVDFFIRVNPTTSPNQAPVFVSPPTPANGATIDVVAGQEATFDVRATDANNNATVTLGTLALPAGATFTKVNGNPATGTFRWTPSAVGQTFITLTAQDQFGLQATQRTVRIVAGDGTPPVITGPGSQDLQATGPGGAVATFSATALDETSGARPVSCSPASGSTFPIGETTITCTASDAAGNVATSTGVITVADSAGPVLSLADVQAEAAGPTGAVVTFTASATDAVDGARPVSCSPASGSAFPLGATSVSCSASDTRGNRSTGTFIVTVSDTTAPVLVLPGDLTAEATGPSGTTVAWSASASDLVDGSVPVSCGPASGALFALGTTPVACQADDAAGNVAEGSFRVGVVDTTGPAVQYTGPTTVEATRPGGAAVVLTGTATDLVDGGLAATCTTPAGTTLPLGVHLVTCRAVDDAGNVGTVEASVTVQDTVAPVVSVPGDTTIEATGPAGAPHTFVASAADAVTPTPATSCTADSGSTFPLGTTTVTCTATDGSGNVGTATFRVSVVDTTGPAITTPGTVVEEATGPNGAVVAFAAAATDV